jgi:hypothetical protein
MKATPPPESFRIATLGRWFLVHIASTVEDMRTCMDEHVGGCSPDLLGGVVMVRGDGDYTNCVGFIFLPRPQLTPCLVAHELAHAAFRVCESAGIHVHHWQRTFEGDRPKESATDASEETYCAVLEILTREFWKKAHAHGFV